MNVVEKILELFDDLDAEESTELMIRLRNRGYELKINKDFSFKDVKKISNEKTANLILKGFNEDFNIRAIKLIRNLNQEYSDVLVDFNIISGLREAKDYCENKNLWESKPLAFGKYNQIEFLYNMLKRDYPDIYFKVEKNEILS